MALAKYDGTDELDGAEETDGKLSLFHLLLFLLSCVLVTCTCALSPVLSLTWTKNKENEKIKH